MTINIITTFIVAGSFAVSLSLLIRTIQTLTRYAFIPNDHQWTDLPSVSVCVAARNEMHALAQCLERVLASDYEKLEILVLDDSSDDTTSLIIKSFANAGVRFIPGKALKEGWLGKNHAYQTLKDEASGDYILFLDVDTTISSTTISQLVNQLGANQKSMISVLPRREDSYRLSALLGTLRYYWELLLANRINPPSASALWMVQRERLEEKAIGLENYAMSVRLERHLARQLQMSGQYQYVIGTKTLGIGFEKHLASQHATALRLYYLLAGRSFKGVLLAMIYLGCLLAPFGVLIFAPSTLSALTMAMSLIMTTLAIRFFFVATYGSIARQLRLLLWPIVVAYEIALFAHSYVVYMFGTVIWKGRPVNARPSRHDELRIDE